MSMKRNNGALKDEQMQMIYLVWTIVISRLTRRLRSSRTGRRSLRIARSRLITGRLVSIVGIRSRSSWRTSLSTTWRLVVSPEKETFKTLDHEIHYDGVTKKCMINCVIPIALRTIRWIHRSIAGEITTRRILLVVLWTSVVLVRVLVGSLTLVTWNNRRICCWRN